MSLTSYRTAPPRGNQMKDDGSQLTVPLGAAFNRSRQGRTRDEMKSFWLLSSI